MTSVYRFLSIDVWGALPSFLQRRISNLYSSIYNTSWSKNLIGPYCRIHYNDPSYLDQFIPASGSPKYLNFQDFFSRRLQEPVLTKDKAIWPAEGLLCEYGQVTEFDQVVVKGEKRHLNTIFGMGSDEIPGDYYFSNIFLHNNNYHRIHAPVSGRISRIERIEGDLVLLRPWLYKNDPSLPALRNERVNIDLIDENDDIWFLSIVGGPAVGTVELPDDIKVGNQVQVGEEIAVFLLGSTCCMASPVESSCASTGDMVAVGNTYEE